MLCFLIACSEEPRPATPVEETEPPAEPATEDEVDADTPPTRDTSASGGAKDSGVPKPVAIDATIAKPRDAQASEGGRAVVADTGAPTSDAGSSPGGAAACTGKPGKLRGKTNQTVMAGGMKRTFIMHVPKSLDPNKPVPLVIVPHGYTQAAGNMYDFTNYPALADKEGFVAAFPDGQPGGSGPWNVGQGACNSVYGLLPLGTGDDQAFIDKMIETATSDQCIDRDHVFVSGWSMGGFLSHETGCLRPDIRAIGPHSGGTHDLSKCKSEKKPVIMFHGTGDKLIPVECGKEARKRWAAHNGCSDEVEMRPVKRGHCEYSKGCPADGQVALCLFDDMNHGWAGGPNAQVAIYPSMFSEYENAAELGWNFFKTHAW
jgi:poly(3-hydroxybutyrate) depolymerase